MLDASESVFDSKETYVPSETSTDFKERQLHINRDRHLDSVPQSATVKTIDKDGEISPLGRDRVRTINYGSKQLKMYNMTFTHFLRVFRVFIEPLFLSETVIL